MKTNVGENDQNCLSDVAFLLAKFSPPPSFFCRKLLLLLVCVLFGLMEYLVSVYKDDLLNLLSFFFLSVFCVSKKKKRPMTLLSFFFPRCLTRKMSAKKRCVVMRSAARESNTRLFSVLLLKDGYANVQLTAIGGGHTKKKSCKFEGLE